MKTIYHFQGFNSPELIKVVFENRENITFASSKTGFKLVDVSNLFYDNDADRWESLDLTEDSFDAKVKLSFARQGYKFIKKENE